MSGSDTSNSASPRGKRFQRHAEAFQCEQCGADVQGDGYTNHCPECLWSKHVDVMPGDRAAVCGGRMRPVAVEGTAGQFVILHRCTACSHTRRNRSSDKDSIDALTQLARGG